MFDQLALFEIYNTRRIIPPVLKTPEALQNYWYHSSWTTITNYSTHNCPLLFVCKVSEGKQSQIFFKRNIHYLFGTTIIAMSQKLFRIILEISSVTA
jgi:hypothetical protein